MKLLYPTITAMLIASASFAQCLPSTAEVTLDINEVNTLMLNGGDMWWDYANQSSGRYEVPKGSGIMSIYAGALWIGGYDAGNQLHLAAQTYRTSGNDFWPGPLDTTGTAAVSPNACSQYDKIWKINRYKVEEFKYEWTLGNVQNATYSPDPDILSWPGNGNTSLGEAHNLAPYVDVNNNGIYDPFAGGDYPKIKGDQMLWWVMNDKGNSHTQTQGLPLGVEIHASAYAYTCPQIADSVQVINYTTLYHYEIFNRSSLALDSVYVGNWQDGDLGCGQDDYVGCNPAGNYGYYYNADNNDEICTGELGYGLNPPISSTIILDGPLATPNDGIDNNNNGAIDESGEKNLMTHFVYYTNGSPSGMGDPSVASEYYNYLSGSWKDSTLFTYGGTGHGGTTLTPFIFPDFPYNTSGWSEKTANNVSGDRRFLMSSGPFNFLPGVKVDFDFAVVWSRDTTLPYLSQSSFDKNLKDNMKITQWFLQDSFPSCLQLNVGVNEGTQNENPLVIFPNPSSDIINVNYISKTKNSQFEIIDVMGRQVFSQLPIAIGTVANSSQQQINISALPQGMYLLKVKDGDASFVKRFVKN